MAIRRYRAVLIFDYYLDSALDSTLTQKQIAALEAEMFADDVETIVDHIEVGQYEVYVKPIKQK